MQQETIEGDECSCRCRKYDFHRFAAQMLTSVQQREWQPQAHGQQEVCWNNGVTFISWFAPAWIQPQEVTSICIAVRAFILQYWSPKKAIQLLPSSQSLSLSVHCTVSFCIRLLLRPQPSSLGSHSLGFQKHSRHKCSKNFMEGRLKQTNTLW